MTISKRDAKLLLILVGVLIFLLGYFLVYQKYTTKTEELQAETTELQATVRELQEYYDNLETYKAGIEQAKATISAELGRYPSAVRYEDQVLYAMGLQSQVGLSVTSIAFGEPLEVSSFQRVEESESGAVSSTPVSARQASMTMTLNLSYEEMKNLIAHVDQTEERTSLKELSVSFDAASGALTGSAILNQYYITDGTEPYAPSAVPTLPLGVEDLFGTYQAAAQETEAAPETEAGQETETAAQN